MNANTTAEDGTPIYTPSEKLLQVITDFRTEIHRAIDAVVQRRIRQYEGLREDEPIPLGDISRNLETVISAERGDIRVLFKWDRQPICVYTPPTWTLKGWQDATICECTPAFCIVDPPNP